MTTELDVSIGRHAARYFLLFAFAAFTPAKVNTGAEVPWYTIDCGGTASSTGGTYVLAGTIGQPDAPSMSAPMTGGSYELLGGFWSVTAVPPSTPGDFDGDGDVDTADFAMFAQCFGGANLPQAPSCPDGVDADLDNDGDVDTADFAIFAQHFTGSM